MRIGELSERSSVPLPTVRYYLREGLLPPGMLTSRNQAQYGEKHLRRLALIRALLDVGGLSVGTARRVLNRVDAPEVTLLDAIGNAQYALTPPGDDPGDGAGPASDEVDRIVERYGWKVRSDNPARRSLAELLVALRALGADDLIALLDVYAESADRLAVADVDMVARRPDTDAMIEGVVIAGVLGDAMFSALRRLAQEDASARRFGGASDAGTPVSPRPTR